MSDELKEILDRLKLLCYDDYCLEFSVDYIERKEEKLLLDYITNLQQKVDQYENPDDLTLFYMWLDEKAKDKMKQLQQENDKLLKICTDYDKQANDYKSRNEKALMFVCNLVSEADCFYNYDILESKKQELEDILKGGDE